MSDSALQPDSIDQMAAITEYLSRGGTYAQINGISDSILEATYDLAYQQYTQGHYREAARRFRYLCFYSQWTPKFYMGLGACQQMMEVYGQAIRAYDYAYRLAPENPQPLIYIGDCYNALKQHDVAILAYQSALDKAQQQNAPASLELARAENMLSILQGNRKEVPDANA